MEITPLAFVAGFAEQGRRLRSLVSHQHRDSAGGGPRPQASWRRDRLPECAPYLGPEPPASSAHSLCDPLWWFVARSPALGSLSLSFLLAGEGTEPGLSRQVRGRFEGSLRSR